MKIYMLTHFIQIEGFVSASKINAAHDAGIYTKTIKSKNRLKCY